MQTIYLQETFVQFQLAKMGKLPTC